MTLTAVHWSESEVKISSDTCASFLLPVVTSFPVEHDLTNRADQVVDGVEVQPGQQGALSDSLMENDDDTDLQTLGQGYFLFTLGFILFCLFIRLFVFWEVLGHFYLLATITLC